VNIEFVLFNLREASEELTKTIAAISEDPSYGDGEFFPAIQHIYHHINTAWNAREAAAEEIEPGTDERWNAWGGFPDDFPLMRA
jgi:hypothetical protein